MSAFELGESVNLLCSPIDSLNSRVLERKNQHRWHSWNRSQGIGSSIVADEGK